jgi:hypothetical protein
MEAYGARYNQLADESRKLGNDMILESAKKQIDFQMKNQERIALTKSTTDGIGKVLAGEGSNLSSQTIQQVQQQAADERARILAGGGMATGGQALNKAKGFAPAQKGGSNVADQIYGIPNAGTTGPNRTATYDYKKGGAIKKYPIYHYP